ncbi:MAG: acyl carrier protein [Nitrospirota bacterium]
MSRRRDRAGEKNDYFSILLVQGRENQHMATDPVISLKIRTALGEYLKRDPETILKTHHLRDDLGLDSMAVIELLYRIEEAFELQIPDEDLMGLTNVGEVVSYVENRLKETTAPVPSKKAAKSPKPKDKKKS